MRAGFSLKNSKNFGRRFSDFFPSKYFFWVGNFLKNIEGDTHGLHYISAETDYGGPPPAIGGFSGSQGWKGLLMVRIFPLN
jgi:hypothetical protein